MRRRGVEFSFLCFLRSGHEGSSYACFTDSSSQCRRHLISETSVNSTIFQDGGSDTCADAVPFSNGKLSEHLMFVVGAVVV